MYTIVNTYPDTPGSNTKDIKTSAARAVYEELLKYLRCKD